MIGMIYSQYYVTKNMLILYLIIALLAGIFFTVLGNEDSANLVAIIIIAFTVTAPTDNLKNEAAANWYKYAITMPVTRKQIVLGHYAYYFITVGLGLVVALVIFAVRLMIGMNNLTQVIAALLIGISFSFLLSLLYPFTYAVGSDKSNLIQMVITVLLVVIYIAFNVVTLLIGGMIYGTGEAAMHHAAFEISRTFLFLIFSFLIALGGYLFAVHKFNKQNF